MKSARHANRQQALHDIASVSWDPEPLGSASTSFNNCVSAPISSSAFRRKCKRVAHPSSFFFQQKKSVKSQLATLSTAGFKLPKYLCILCRLASHSPTPGTPMHSGLGGRDFRLDKSAHLVQAGASLADAWHVDAQRAGRRDGAVHDAAVRRLIELRSSGSSTSEAHILRGRASSSTRKPPSAVMTRWWNIEQREERLVIDRSATRGALLTGAAARMYSPRAWSSGAPDW